jgi:hypothetical protein
MGEPYRWGLTAKGFGRAGVRCAIDRGASEVARRAAWALVAVPAAPDAIDDPALRDHASLAGRIALATQGVLYLVVGLLAIGVARGDESDRPSQTGALESIARQPFGRVALVVVMVGLVIHALWRLWLAVVGEPGDDDDAGSLAKRAANVGRAAIYLSFLGAAVRLLTKGEGSSGGSTEEQSTDTVLSWPGGQWLVVAAGLVVIGVAGWNVRKAVARTFLDDLDLRRAPHLRRVTVGRIGAVGYLGRAAAFGVIGWFLIDAGRQHDPDEARGLDDALRELTTATYGPLLLFVVAVALGTFGAFRILDGLLRRDDALAHS